MNRQWILSALPKDKLTTDAFEFTTGPVPEPGAGQLLVRQHYLNVMPGNRAYMHDNVGASMETGVVMPGLAHGEVVTSNHTDFAPGDVVDCYGGWQDYAVVDANLVEKREPGLPFEHYAGLLGQSGHVAYIGLLHIAKPRAGQTLLVSAAAGGIGNLVVQLGKLSGCRVVGVAGGPEKCEWLRQDVGADETIDYKAGDLDAQMKEKCPEGVDLYFDNVGGAVLESALNAMKVGGRIICCGNTSQYDVGELGPGPRGVPVTIIQKDLTLQGFAFMRYSHLYAEADRKMWEWFQAGRVKPFYHVFEGLEHAPDALIAIMNGKNRGISMIRV